MNKVPTETARVPECALSMSDYNAGCSTGDRTSGTFDAQASNAQFPKGGITVRRANQYIKQG